MVFHGAFTERVEAVRPNSPKVKLWLWVDDGSGPCPSWAVPYEDAASSAEIRVTPPWDRSADDLIFIYTGGTTGMPKGVMWRHDDLFQLSDISDYPENADRDAVSHRLGTTRPAAGIPVCPLMHGTGFLTVLSVLSSGGCVVTLSGRRFDVVELFDTIEREQVGRLCIVGDAFARPMLGALDEHPDRWSLSSLKVLITSGAMCSEPVKEGLIAHHPGLMIADLLGASEALGVGMSISGGRGAKTTASFRPGSNTRVLTDDGIDVEPGSGASGLLAVGGPTSLGYYKDSDKPAKTFRTVDGHGRDLHRGKGRLYVFRTVIEIGRNLVVALGPVLKQRQRYAVRSAVQFGPSKPTVALHLSDSVRLFQGYVLPYVGKVPTGHGEGR